MTAPIQPTAPAAETGQAIIEQAIPATRVVHDYGLSWTLYILATCVFLVVLYRLMRKWPKWLLVPIWSACAAGALTPASSTPDGPWLAPAAIVAIFGLDQDGVTGLMRGAVPILFSFVTVMAVLSLVFVALAKWPRKTVDNPVAEPAAAPEAEADRHEPKL